VDADDLPSAPPAPDGSRFRLAYVGTLYGERNLGPVLEALRALLRRGSIDPEHVDLRIVGNVWLGRELEADGLPLSVTGYVDHRTAMKEMAAATALLFFGPTINPATSGKIYEYLASGRPVLCVAGPDSGAARLVEDLGAGHTVRADDGPAIEAAILRLYSAWRNGGIRTQPEVREAVLSGYSRKALTGELAQVFDAVTPRTA
jgi:glycosyltransferase involved in cell wall biosynthesis